MEPSTQKTMQSYTASFEAQDLGFRIKYFVIAWIQALTIPILLAGQTMGLFFYDWATQYGLQEDREEVGKNVQYYNIFLDEIL